MNGVVTALIATRDQLVARGFSVSIIHPGQFFTVPLPTYPEMPLALFAFLSLSKRIQSENPDYIHIATEGLLGYYALLACRKLGLIFTSSYHTHLAEHVALRATKRISIWAVRYLRWFHSFARVTMVATPGLQRELVHLGYERVVVAPLGVDLERFHEIQNEDERINFPRPIFLYAGRVSREKNIEEFLDCVLPGTKVVVGDGPERADLEKKYGATIKFVGYQEGKELVRYFASADVFVFPSRTDTFGLVVIEALACGAPVAAHDVMGPGDIIITGVDGVLSEDLGQAAKDCLSLSRSACRAKALRYSWAHAAEVFVSHLVFARDKTTIVR